MKCHKWKIEDDSRLLKAIEDCTPLFEHFKNQGETYSDMNVWDAIAGRMLPLTLTGAACKRHFEVMRERESQYNNDVHDNGWEHAEEMVERYERDLAESTYDAVENLLQAITMLTGIAETLQADVKELKDIWK